MHLPPPRQLGYLSQFANAVDATLAVRTARPDDHAALASNVDSGCERGHAARDLARERRPEVVMAAPTGGVDLGGVRQRAQLGLLQVPQGCESVNLLHVDVDHDESVAPAAGRDTVSTPRKHQLLTGLVGPPLAARVLARHARMVLPTRTLPVRPNAEQREDGEERPDRERLKHVRLARVRRERVRPGGHASPRAAVVRCGLGRTSSPKRVSSA